MDAGTEEVHQGSSGCHVHEPLKEYVQLSAFLLTYLAGIPVTVKDVGTDIFIVVLRPFLVQFPVDLRIFHASWVETSKLNGKAVSFREKILQLFDPPDMVVCL